MRSILVTPMSPRLAGNGLAQRCAMWHEALAGVGPVTTIVAPVAGPSAPDGDELVVRPTGVASPDLPRLAHGLTVELGREVDLVVAVRSYTALLGIGMRDAAGAQLVVSTQGFGGTRAVPNSVRVAAALPTTTPRRDGSRGG